MDVGQVQTMSSRPDRITFQNRLNVMINGIRRDILTHKYPAGEFIPSELTLAEQYQISRKSVRKGLDILIDEGLLKKVPRVGNMINSTDSFQKITIKLGRYPHIERETALQDLLELFHMHYPHIKVETIPLPYDHYIDAAREFINNGWIDALMLNNKHYLEAVDRQALELFEPLDAQPEQYDFLNSVFTNENQLLVKPLIFSPVVLCYNKNLFRHLGLSEPDSSWSWEELTRVATIFIEKMNILGFYADIASLNRFPIILLQNNVAFSPTNQGYNYNDPLLWESLQSFRDLFYVQGIPPAFLSDSDADTEKLFAQQKVAMILTTYFGMNMLKDPEFEYGITPVPYHKDAKTMLLVTGISVSRQSKHKEVAGLLADFLASPSSQLHIRKHTLSIPAHKPSAEWTGPEHIYRPSRFSCYRDIIPSFQSYKDLNIEMQALEAFQKELKLFWSNLESPESVMKRLMK